MIVERFRRPVTAWGRTRQGRVGTYPDAAVSGPFVVLTNEHTGSDGDIFPRAIQLEKLAPVIGKRSWGGVVGINVMRGMVDGGIVTYPFAELTRLHAAEPPQRPNFGEPRRKLPLIADRL